MSRSASARGVQYTATNKRRSPIIELTSTAAAYSTSEEDLTKALLAAKKNPPMISKRRGSAVSIESLASNSRRNSIVMIEEQTTTTTSSQSGHPYPNGGSQNKASTTTTTKTTTVIVTAALEEVLGMEKILLEPMDTDEFIATGVVVVPPMAPREYADGWDADLSDDSDEFCHASNSYPLSSENWQQQRRPQFYHRKSFSEQVPSHPRKPSVSSVLSSPIPFFNTGRPLVPSMNYDNHYEYKQRTRQTTRKLANFFGDNPPMDICVREIEKEGLKAMLHSKIPLCYFLYSLLEEYACENLFFFLEVEQYESYNYINAAQQTATAQHIFETYLTRNSQFEVNVDDKVRRSVISAMQSGFDPRHCFDEAKRAIFILLETSFARFIRSPTAEMMKREIGNNTTQYTAKARDAAVCLLMRFLDRQAAGFKDNKPANGHGRSKSKGYIAQISNPHSSSASTSPIPSPTSNISRRRYELVRTMIHEFVRSLLGVDVENFLYDLYRNKNAERLDRSADSSGTEYECLSEGHEVLLKRNGKNLFRKPANKGHVKNK